MALMTKQDFIDLIKRRLGYPSIKLEINDQTINDHLNFAIQKFIKWAVGQSSQEVYFTMPMSGGQYVYDMPVGTIDVISYTNESSSYGGINTLFTVENYLYSNGYYDPLLNNKNSEPFSIVSFHLVLDFLETLKKYDVQEYSWKYHWTTNQLEIRPTPKCGNSLTITTSNTCSEESDEYTIDSPGFMLIKAQMITGASLEGYTSIPDNESHFLGLDWVIDYVTALTMKTIGLIRRKFSNFQSIGNQGISLDGDTMYSDAIQELERLEQTLRLEERYEGFGIFMG